MTRDDIDIMWNKSLGESIKNGEQFTRYYFAKIVAAEERQKIGEDIMAFYRTLVEQGNPAKAEVEHCLGLIRLRAKS